MVLYISYNNYRLLNILARRPPKGLDRPLAGRPPIAHPPIQFLINEMNQIGTNKDYNIYTVHNISVGNTILKKK